MLLVECKAEQVPLNESVATQIAEYAQHVKTPWWLVTNGRRDIWFDLQSSRKPRQQHDPPEDFIVKSLPGKRSFEYWQRRAFLGNPNSDVLDQWLCNAVDHLFNSGEFKNITYLSFNSSPLEFDISHYYLIKRFKRLNLKIAYSFLRTPAENTLLLAICNRNDENTGLMTVDMQMLYEQESTNTKIYTQQKKHDINLQKHLKIDFDNGQDSQQFSTLLNEVAEIFNQYSPS